MLTRPMYSLLCKIALPCSYHASQRTFSTRRSGKVQSRFLWQAATSKIIGKHLKYIFTKCNGSIDQNTAQSSTSASANKNKTRSPDYHYDSCIGILGHKHFFPDRSCNLNFSTRFHVALKIQQHKIHGISSIN